MELQTNLLPLRSLPGHICYGDTDVPGYPQLRQLLGNFKLRCHLYGGKLVFLGNPDPLLALFNENSQYSLQNVGQIKLTKEILSKRREVIIPILYDVIAAFFGYKGLRRVPNQRRHVFMVEHNSIEVGKHPPQQLIYTLEEFKNRKKKPHQSQSTESGPYVHEGFEYQLEFVRDDLYLALIPRIVLTTNREEVTDFEDTSAIYTSLNAYRWNSELRWLLYIWARFLGQGSVSGKITVLTSGREELVFSSFYAKVMGE